MSKKVYNKPQVTLEELEQQLIDANKALWETNCLLETEKQSQTELITNMSHDLRAPLSALRSIVELMKAKPDSSLDEQRNMLDIIDQRLIMLEKMINDLFLLACVENHTDIPERESINAGIFIEEYFYSCEVDYKFNKRFLKIDVPQNFPFTIQINVPQMLRVLDNLMTNALRYSEDNDNITIGSKYYDNKKIIIYVEDTGIGIAQENLTHIFERSFCADIARSPSEGRTGLGLAIAKGIVEQHDGKIWCESKEGQWSRFSIELPCIEEEL